MSHLSNGEKKLIESSISFGELAKIALGLITKLPQPLAQVSGPISTGGKGDVKENLKEFDDLIKLLKSNNINVFDQVPFENTIGKIKDVWHKEGNDGYCMPILEDFYRPIIKSGHIKYFFFLPDWETSYGAKWERKECKQHNVRIIDLPENWRNNLSFLNEI